MSDAKPDCICGGAGPAFTEFIKNMGPSEGAKKHFVQARVEFLKGLRAIIDRKIDEISKEPEKGAKVTVE